MQKKIVALATCALLIGAEPSLAQTQPAQQQTAPAAAPQPPPPVASMTRQQLRDAVTEYRPYVNSGGVRPRRPPGCSAPEQRQFDFWLGEWDVLPTGVTPEMVVGENTITMHAQGCVIQEDWRPFRGPAGRSLNGYNATDGMWHQYYLDATGRITVSSGAFSDGVMTLDNMNPLQQGVAPGTRTRMRFQLLDADTVRQWGESFDPATNEWSVSWDLTYRRRANSRVPQ